ncbi:hypothetical protein OE88DRAFT_1656869 [Heliocybe sulcata]|uniref:Uncharacterized protein n=1 Tax=Heliocybe sulcata TaxID=5364 RepID=A0A5C3NAQ5_9AGAM|nr:hypothetical protein OE88DRAFT_1656869 [Heliocybe sulcata]
MSVVSLRRLLERAGDYLTGGIVRMSTGSAFIMGEWCRPDMRICNACICTTQRRRSS